MTNKLNIEETVDIIPRNWIPKQNWNLKTQALRQSQAVHRECSNSSRNSRESQDVTEVHMYEVTRKDMTLMFQQPTHKSSKDSEISLLEGIEGGPHISQHTKDCSTEKCEPVEQS